MEWTKSNISKAELEQKQQAYIKEALEMAKRSSAKTQDDEAARARETAERKAAEEKAAAERKAAEKAAAERKAAEKAAAEKRAAEKKAEAERKEAEKAAAEKKAKEKAAAEKKAEEAAAEVERAEDNADDEAESEELIDPEDFAELIGAEDTEGDDIEESGSEKQGECSEEDGELIDTAQLAHTKSSEKAHKDNTPANFNQFVNQHNNKAQCNCPNCRRKRAMMQQ